MPFDPLANILQLQGDPLEPKNRYDRYDSEATHKLLLSSYKQLAVITSVDDESADRYFVDIYNPTYMKDLTHPTDPIMQDVICHASTPYDYYEEGDLVRIILLDDCNGIIVSEKAPQLVVVTNAGPSGEADFTDNRYWAKLAFCSNAGSSSTATADAQAYPEPLQKIISFTNLQEDVSSHGDLAIDDIAYVNCEYNFGNLPTSRPTKIWMRDVSIGIKNIRYNTTTHKLQFTYSIDPVEADWVDITTATPCNSAT